MDSVARVAQAVRTSPLLFPALYLAQPHPPSSPSFLPLQAMEEFDTIISHGVSSSSRSASRLRNIPSPARTPPTPPTPPATSAYWTAQPAQPAQYRASSAQAGNDEINAHVRLYSSLLLVREASDAEIDPLLARSARARTSRRTGLHRLPARRVAVHLGRGCPAEGTTGASFTKSSSNGSVCFRPSSSRFRFR